MDRAVLSPNHWLVPLLASVALLGVGEAVILEVNLGFFTSGYGGAYADTLVLRTGFFLAAALCDAFLLLACWTALLPLLRLLRVPSQHRVPLLAVFSLSLPVSLDFARYVAEGILGRITSIAALWQLAGRSLVEMAAQSLDQLPALAWYGVFSGLGAGAAVLLVQRLARFGIRAATFSEPRLRVLAPATLVCGGLAALVLAPRAPQLDAIQFALQRKPSALLLTLFADRLTDFDRDGTGMVARPSDGAPLDAGIHPYALEIPGNGVDENGLGGDLPKGFPAPAPVAAPLVPPVVGPVPEVVLLIFLESFRADLLGRRFQGREVTPTLNQLAREGAYSERAYAHTPLTAESRNQLFQGRLAPRKGARSLIDDFQVLGYEVAHFSGQDDSFAKSDEILELEKADHFYDARRDADLRSGPGASRGALQVSWKLLTRRVREYLEARDRSRPLFLYVNLVDTHFPYDHPELDRVFDVIPLARGEIRPAKRDLVLGMYLNAAANVDRGVRELLRVVRETTVDPALVITADHGEAFYEDGVLGHGRRLDDAGTRVPLVLVGIGGEWPEPLGLADIRGLLSRNLSALTAGPRRSRFVPDPERTVLLCMPRLDRPYLVGARRLSGAISYDLGSGRIGLLGPPGEREAEAELLTLVRSWEAQRLRERP